MAIVHNMGHRSRKYSIFILGVKRFVGSVLIVIGSVFSGITVLSFVLRLANLLMNDFLELDFMKNAVIEKLCYYAKRWLDYLGGLVVRMMDFLDRFSYEDPYFQNRTDSILQIGLLLLSFIIMAVTLIIVFRFGSILRNAGNGLRAPSSGEEGGLLGEIKALKVLKKLPDDTHVFTNLEFEKRGHHETDIIIVGPYGVIVCEIKYWSGHIIYDKDDEKEVKCVDRHGNVKSMHSPINQVIAHYETLNSALLDYDVNVNPGGMVFMMHPKVSIEGFELCPITVLEHPSIQDVTCQIKGNQLTKEQIEQTVQTLNKIAV